MAPPKRTVEELADAEQLGARIRNFRKTLGLSVDQVAVRAGISSDHLATLERGRHVAYERTLRRVAKALGTSLVWLQTGKKS